MTVPTSSPWKGSGRYPKSVRRISAEQSSGVSGDPWLGRLIFVPVPIRRLKRIAALSGSRAALA